MQFLLRQVDVKVIVAAMVRFETRLLSVCPGLAFDEMPWESFGWHLVALVKRTADVRVVVRFHRFK